MRIAVFFLMIASAFAGDRDRDIRDDWKRPPHGWQPPKSPHLPEPPKGVHNTPEPATWMMGGVGLLLVIAGRRRASR